MDIWRFFTGHTASVTRLGDLLDLGQLFKAFGNVCKGFFKFLVKSFLGNFNRHLATFFWSH